MNLIKATCHSIADSQGEANDFKYLIFKLFSNEQRSEQREGRGVSPGGPSGALFLWRCSLAKRVHRTGTHTPNRDPERGVDMHTLAHSLREG